MTEGKEYRFQTETAKLLQMVIHSVYSDKEIFLRELISNASDAIDRRYALALRDPDGQWGPAKRDAYSINLLLQKEKRLLWIRDNGIGMDEDNLYRCLGTIAKSGTAAAAEENEEALIGQFGIGFYSLFMAADHVVVVSRKAGSDEAYAFESSGVESFTITKSERQTVGTDVILHIREDDGNDTYNRYLREYTLYKLVRRYSDFIRWPILLYMPVPGKNGEPQERWGWQRLNSMIPLWQRKSSEVTEEMYDEFWREFFAAELDPAPKEPEVFGRPLRVLHLHMEGRTEFRALLYIPACAWKTYDTREDVKGLQLYANGVRIKDREEMILPEEFSFVHGAVDCPSLSLDLSRERAQGQETLNAIRPVLYRKILQRLMESLRDDRTRYERFFHDFGPSLKLSAMENDGKKQEELLKLLLFDSTDGMVTLDECAEKSVKRILYGHADDTESLRRKPQAEMPLQNSERILCLKDITDRMIPQVIETYKNIPLIDIAGSEAQEGMTEQSPLCGFIRSVLKGEIDDAAVSLRLSSAPVLLSSRNGIPLDMEERMKEADPSVRAEKVLEINAEHPAIKILDRVRLSDPQRAETYVRILYTQARMTAGLPLEDPAVYTDLLVSLFYE